MYNGLFGDLPSTKKASETGKNSDPSTCAEKKTDEKQKPAPATPAGGNDMQQEPKVKTPRFVPLQMKRPRKTAIVPKKKKVSKSKGNTVVVDMSQDRATNEIPQKAPKEVASVSVIEDQVPLTVKDAISASQECSDIPATIAEEPEYLRDLHEQAKEDLYDPMVPNDLLHYWEHQRSIQEKERLLHEQQIALREHERMRQALEEERQRLQAEGNVEKIVQHTVQRQQGRKISNVPAWLLEQQRAQREGGGGDVVP